VPPFRDFRRSAFQFFKVDGREVLRQRVISAVTELRQGRLKSLRLVEQRVQNEKKIALHELTQRQLRVVLIASRRRHPIPPFHAWPSDSKRKLNGADILQLDVFNVDVVAPADYHCRSRAVQHCQCKLLVRAENACVLFRAVARERMRRAQECFFQLGDVSLSALVGVVFVLGIFYEGWRRELCRKNNIGVRRVTGLFFVPREQRHELFGVEGGLFSGQLLLILRHPPAKYTIYVWVGAGTVEQASSLADVREIGLEESDMASNALVCAAEVGNAKGEGAFWT